MKCATAFVVQRILFSRSLFFFSFLFYFSRFFFFIFRFHIFSGVSSCRMKNEQNETSDDHSNGTTSFVRNTLLHRRCLRHLCIFSYNQYLSIRWERIFRRALERFLNRAPDQAMDFSSRRHHSSVHRTMKNFHKRQT